MRELDYPSIDDHIQQHKNLIAQLNDIARKIGSEEWREQELELLLADWLLDHIRIYDARLAAYVSHKTQANWPASSDLFALPQQF
jgi:hemerythrin